MANLLPLLNLLKMSFTKATSQKLYYISLCYIIKVTVALLHVDADGC